MRAEPGRESSLGARPAPALERRPGPPGRLLVRATLLFLTAPVAVFLLGWLRGPWSWVALAALAAATWGAARRLEEAAAEDEAARPSGRPPGAVARWAPHVAGACLLALVVSLLGAGGVGVQSWDWQKHSAVLADLVAQPWPVAWRVAPQADLVLVYYVAYYLPAALAGAAFGWLAANAALFAWTVAGVMLAWRWIGRLGRASPAAALLVVVLFTGFDLLGALLAAPAGAGALPWWRQFDLEWWHGRFVLPGNVTLIAYAPHQAIGGWLASALCLEALRRGVHRFPFALPLTACLLWSPFAAAGLALLVVAFVLAGGAGGARRAGALARGQLGASSLAAAAGVALPLLLYFAARLPAPVLPADLVPPPGGRAAGKLAFLPLTLGPLGFAAEWARFLAVELLPLVAALAVLLAIGGRRRAGGARFDARLLLAAAALLALLPCAAYGYYDDWLMRSSIPPLFALQVLSARALSDAAAPRAARRGFAALLLVAGLFPLAQLRLQAAAVVARGAWVAVPTLSSVDDLFAQQRGPNRHFAFLEQYVASADRPFFRLLARPLQPRRVAAPASSQPQVPAGVTRSSGPATGSRAKPKPG